MKAYVLINVQAGKVRQVLGKLRKIAGVREAYCCWGRPDIFAFVEVPNEIALTETVLAKIQTMGGIESTDTHIVIG